MSVVRIVALHGGVLVSEGEDDSLFTVERSRPESGLRRLKSVGPGLA
jgi:hypothetical protein